MNKTSVVIKQYGDAELLSFEKIRFDESLGPHEVLIEVHYSGINFADIVMRLGMYQDAPPRPFIPGYEVSGIVTKVGRDVQRILPGDRVMAGTRFGGYTSVLKLPYWQVVKIDQELSLEEAAAIPVNFFTAQIALNEFFRVRAGDKVLIDCATGGVGVFCLQMAKAAGADVIGLTSQASKKAFIQSYGAKAMTHEEFWASDEKDFSYVLNSTGGKSLKGFYQRLDKSGLLMCIGLQQAITDGKSSLWQKLKALLQSPWYPIIKLMLNSRAVAGFNALKFFDDERWMRRLVSELEKNQFKPHVDKVFRASEVALAHKYLESKKAKGKVLISWKEEHANA